jgi:hypothetical protein
MTTRRSRGPPPPFPLAFPTLPPPPPHSLSKNRDKGKGTQPRSAHDSNVATSGLGGVAQEMTRQKASAAAGAAVAGAFGAMRSLVTKNRPVPTRATLADPYVAGHAAGPEVVYRRVRRTKIVTHQWPRWEDPQPVVTYTLAEKQVPQRVLDQCLALVQERIGDGRRRPIVCERFERVATPRESHDVQPDVCRKRARQSRICRAYHPLTGPGLPHGGRAWRTRWPALAPRRVRLHEELGDVCLHGP